MNRCTWQTHYGTIAPRYANEPNGPTAWEGECGKPTNNPDGICDEHGDDMDDCPVCERLTRYDGEECTECGRLWGVDYSREDIEERQGLESTR